MLPPVLQRNISPDGVIYYASPLLSQWHVPHALSTRLGGVSAPPFDSLNLGNPSGCALQDSTGQIQQNYRLLQQAIGLADSPRCYLHQVHGGTAVRVIAGAPLENGIQADALVSDDPSRIIAVRTADCVPILLAADNGKRVAAIHAGWRGVIAGVVPHAIEALDAAANTIRAAIGPCIGFDAFEVGEEVLAEFRCGFGEAAPIRQLPHGKGLVDLRAAVHLQLLRAGVAVDRIDQTDRCTFRDRDEFFSHRRDKGITGRMAALIAARG